MNILESCSAHLRVAVLPRWITGLCLLAPTLFSQVQAQQAPVVTPRPGMVITRSVKLAPGTYRFPGRGGDSAIITIRGDDIDLDLTGVVLEGIPPGTDPDQARGIAILIDGGHRVSLMSATVRGYQTAIRAVGTVDLNIGTSDLSGNWRPRLFSGVEHESLVDWLSFHHNENGEWRRFGAGIALEDVHRAVIGGNRVRHGMNGLLLTRSDSVIVAGNDFSFNSGLGIGLYRSSRNRIESNRADYNVRGYSDGFYHRGQDSADLLMFEQSSENLVRKNSMTHGGDGLFLWAGQHTMDTGEGGSNDNRFVANDFSYAPTNGMEATFSRNRFIGNRIVGSDHGFWGGYSFSSPVLGNCFARNRVAIAIEHGQDDTIAGNRFLRDSTAIQLWADSIVPSDWGYPKHRDTRSRDWSLSANHFFANRVALRVRQTTRLRQAGDVNVQVDTAAVMRDTAQVTLGATPGTPSAWDCEDWLQLPLELPDTDLQVFTPGFPESEVASKDRSAIIIDEWGPYDWTTPKLWPNGSPRDLTVSLQVLGPPGRWHTLSSRGVSLQIPHVGNFGDLMTVGIDPDSVGDWSVELADSAGHRFGFSYFEPIGSWDVRYLNWSDSTGWNAAPFFTRREPRLDKMWYRPPADLPQANWALEATTTVDLPRGEYTLRTISDDAIQVWIDGRLAIDHADPHESLVDNVAMPAGRHTLKARYRQVDGWVELRVEIVRGHVTSTGSPGPH